MTTTRRIGSSTTFPVSSTNTPKMSSVKVDEAGGISVVDFGSFLDGSRKQEVADAIVQSFKDIGFVYLINHGLAEAKVDSMFDWSKRFFAQPMDVKMLAPHPTSGSHHRGYSAPGVEKVVNHIFDPEELKKRRAQAPDLKENFECGREDDPVMPNIWLPDGVFPGFKEACMDFYWACHDVLEVNFLRALALGLELSEDYFLQYHSKADNQLRLLHYPSVAAEKLKNEEVTRIGAHSDFGSLTFLFQDAVGGLEVEDPHSPGQFRGATPVPGAVIVNAGDFLQRWSNDTLRSTVHRVRAPPGLTSADGMTPERYSIPYFCAPNFTTVVDCIPTTYSAERPKKYEPVSAAQYIIERLNANY
ncbi:thymine dioxygenase [Phanerochaete sordida]|uniref:Thymine dioxygenase n=1 Tax=Phanerochaete sordida TaxID=48140 RepID=A0A9P3FZR7_9APHY|nr:thymine dioxygenase [Phanerochaete sordida]